MCFNVLTAPFCGAGLPSPLAVGQNGHQMIASSVSNLFGAIGRPGINARAASVHFTSLHFQRTDPTTSFKIALLRVKCSHVVFSRMTKAIKLRQQPFPVRGITHGLTSKSLFPAVQQSATSQPTRCLHPILVRSIANDDRKPGSIIDLRQDQRT